MPKNDSRLVYSTETGRIRTNNEDNTDSNEPHKKPGGDNVVRVGRETKGRKGSGMTVITGLPVSPAELKQIAKQIKKHCGVGGAIKDQVIEIQGDQRDKIVVWLTKNGFKAVRAGG